MLLQANNKLKRDKKGISEVIGYILLVAVSITISILVYQWLSTYVPKQTLACDEGTSFFVKDFSYDCINQRLNITIENNGKFSIEGYYIHASNNTDTSQLATIDLSQRILDKYGKLDTTKIYGNSVIFLETVDNDLSPSTTRMHYFNVTGYGKLTKIELIPTRIQNVESKRMLVTCTDAKITELITCS